MWARLLSSTNQPSFLNPKDVKEDKIEEKPPTQLLNGDNSQYVNEAKEEEKSATQLLDGVNGKDEQQSEDQADNNINT